MLQNIFCYTAVLKNIHCLSELEDVHLGLFEVLALKLLLLKVIVLISQVTFFAKKDKVLKHKYSRIFSSLGKSVCSSMNFFIMSCFFYSKVGRSISFWRWSYIIFLALDFPGGGDLVVLA